MSYDVIVIGGSFAGLSAALQLAGSRRRVLVMDSGEPRNRFAKFSHGFFGHDGQTPSALLVKARSQLLSYSTVSFVDDMATHSAKAGEEFVVTAATGIVRTASRLILATGVRDNLSTIPGLQERWGESMLHCFIVMGTKWLDDALAYWRLAIALSKPPCFCRTGATTSLSLPTACLP